MMLQGDQALSGNCAANPQAAGPVAERKWFATFTLPQNEKSVLKQLDVRNVESFLPTYESVRVWKNRQRKKVTLPLFPTYLFVRINRAERGTVLQCPGVLHIVGNHREPLALADAEVELLRSGVCRRQVGALPRPCHRRQGPHQERYYGGRARYVGETKQPPPLRPHHPNDQSTRCNRSKRGRH